jgi:hypothetical protein
MRSMLKTARHVAARIERKSRCVMPIFIFLFYMAQSTNVHPMPGRREISLFIP